MLRRFFHVGFLAAFLPVQALGADASWLDERFDVMVRDQSVRDVIEQFGAMVGVPTLVSDKVDAVVSAKFVDAAAEEILDGLTRRYSLDWRFDGHRLEVSDSSEQVRRVLSMGGVSQADLVGALEELNAYDARFPLTAIDGQVALLAGPPRYVAVVEIVLAGLAERRLVEQAEARVLREQQLEEERVRLEDARGLERIRAEALARQSVIRNEVRRQDGPLINRGGRWGG